MAKRISRMIMNKTSRTITGVITALLGGVLLVIGIIDSLWLIAYGIFLIIIGTVIFFNTKEDDIEQIKKQNKK